MLEVVIKCCGVLIATCEFGGFLLMLRIFGDLELYFVQFCLYLMQRMLQD